MKKKIKLAELEVLLADLPDSIRDAAELGFEHLTPKASSDSPSDTAFFEDLLKAYPPEMQGAMLKAMLGQDKPPTAKISLIEHAALNEAVFYTATKVEDIVFVVGDYTADQTLTIDEHQTFIVSGNFKARHIIVRGTLCVTGNLDCKTLYGNSDNDYETIIGGNLTADCVAEFGHLTTIQGSLSVDVMINLLNEIKVGQGTHAQKIITEYLQLDAAFLNKEGYFDETRFLEALT